MGVTRIGINGFGRIGRAVLRAALNRPDVEVVAVNHYSRRLPPGPGFTSYLATALKYDSVHGVLPLPVRGEEKALVVGERTVSVFAEADPVRIPWGELGVEVVVEATGRLRSREKASAHLEAGARKVVITAPAKDADLTVVMGVNEGSYDPTRHHILSSASCTTNCLAPVVKVLHRRFGVVRGLVNTVHAYTNDQVLLDMPHRDPRRGRAAAASIIPTTTGAAQAIGLVMPELAGKLDGMALRVPVLNVSALDLVVELAKKTSAEEINAALEEEANNGLRGILAVCWEPLVSRDFIGDSHSAVVDAPSTMVVEGHSARVLAWYDNEWGYACRVLDLVSYVGQGGT
ncbi:type I glyceraldehyde-3-phosphate dehydrogenase [Ammonifex thiophilus]|uniref:Glyceraldehyde-3-phosphate dehydrogenase n=1 Tax=Ammonifex thiophilus TaxID=444093 RepID=A0A3D8P4V0_9THEO|nr:type I glyceraldehyde-3-phosphate dehydrogenase [Ammonifex thiophilus]RDV84234.1 glyceraldehyde-3-phosphate dehydrogenase [Ammonifex thiophilus]